MGNEWHDSGAETQHLRHGGPVRVLLVVDSAPLLLRMTQTLRTVPRAKLAGAFTTLQDVLDWRVWDRAGWHLAYVDLKLQRGKAQDLVRELLAEPRPGTIVGLSDHMWREVRDACAAMGVYAIVEKGDLPAFRDDLEKRVR